MSSDAHIKRMLATIQDSVHEVYDMVDGIEKRVNKWTPVLEKLRETSGDQEKALDDQRDRLSRIEGELNAKRKTDVHVNASTNIDKVNQSGSGSSVIDQSAGKTHE